MTKFHLFSQDSVSLPSNGWEPWLETAPTGAVRKSYSYNIIHQHCQKSNLFSTFRSFPNQTFPIHKI